jgi:hypothetical protein
MITLRSLQSPPHTVAIRTKFQLLRFYNFVLLQQRPVMCMRPIFYFISRLGLIFGGRDGTRSDSGAGNFIDFSHCWESQALGTAGNLDGETLLQALTSLFHPAHLVDFGNGGPDDRKPLAIQWGDGRRRNVGFRKKVWCRPAQADSDRGWLCTSLAGYVPPCCTASFSVVAGFRNPP